MQLQNPVMPEAAGCTGTFANSIASGGGNLFGFGGGLTSGSQGSHSHSKRQQVPAWLESLIPKSSVFVGGGGSVGSGSAFAVPTRVSDVRSGAYVGPKDTFQFSSEIINYDRVDKDIYLTLDFEWVPGKVENLHNVGMGSVGLDCGSFAFQPPKNKPITYHGSNWTIIADGYFVNFTPHLHDGGVNVKVFLNGK
jgi:hypothetical protein